MSYTELKVAELNGFVETYQEYRDAWGGLAYIWNSIWNKYLKKGDLDTWLIEKNHKRLWDAVKDEKIPGWIRLIHASTFDYIIVEYNKLPIISRYYKKFVETFPPPPAGCHLIEWSEDCMKIYNEYNSNNCAGICFYGTSIVEDIWEDYNLSKSDKHRFLFEEYSEKLGLNDEMDQR